MAGGLDLRDYRLSPIFGPLDKIDRIYLFVGTREIFYPDVTEFYDRLESAGKDVELYVGFGLNHVFPAYPIPEADEAIGEICMIISE